MTFKKWISVTLFSLLLVATLGVLLRYKIAFSLPVINQKYLQHSHSHFAMCGWLTQMLMILLSNAVSKAISPDHFKTYNFILFANLVISYGMLVSFLFQGYGGISIFFSTLSVLVVYYFAIQLWRDMNRSPLKLSSFIWFKGALIFSVLSTFGVMMLAYLMATKNININIQQATTYFYLHFQYNGWFIFACLGLLINVLQNQNIQIKNTKKFFWVYAIACIPAYFLSTLWLPLPLWLYIIVVISAITLLGGWIWFFMQLRKGLTSVLYQTQKIVKWLLGLSALAFTIKVILQAGSVVPSLNNLAFGYRPIVIGYLHLVFLGVVSLFILGYLTYTGYLKVTKPLSIGIVIFIIGIILNELALMTQGVTAMGYYNLPLINETLMGITALMLLGTLTINMAIQQDESTKNR